MPFADVVNEAIKHAHDRDETLAPHEHPDSPVEQDGSSSKLNHAESPMIKPAKTPHHSASRGNSDADTPARRTGPPRSISHNYSYQHTSTSGQGSQQQNEGIPEVGEEDSEFPFMSRGDSEFRGALEYHSPGQREREKEAAEKKGKKRESRMTDDSWNPLKQWFHDSPREEKAGFDFTGGAKEGEGESAGDARNQTMDDSQQVKEKPVKAVQRSTSLPHSKQEKTSRGHAKWAKLRSLLPLVANQGKAAASTGQTAINQQQVNITDELMIGGLSTVMLRLWFERDEKDRRRIPILFHRLRIRITDSLHPMQDNKSVFRIECEYANGAMRWVVYRQLRDFLSLHAHYTFSNAYNRNIEAMPEFPRTSRYSVTMILSASLTGFPRHPIL